MASQCGRCGGAYRAANPAAINELDAARRVDALSVGKRQAVELANVLNLDPRVVILDEPTSVLTPAETRRLHGFIRDLGARR